MDWNPEWGKKNRKPDTSSSFSIKKESEKKQPYGDPSSLPSSSSSQSVSTTSLAKAHNIGDISVLPPEEEEVTDEPELGYDPTEVDPYLITEQPGEKIHPKKSPVDQPNPTESAEGYLYQSSTYRNLASIMVGGLDPNFGGSEGGSSALLPPGQLRDESMKGSAKAVHGAQNLFVAHSYARRFGSAATEGTRADPQEKYNEQAPDAVLGDFPVMLRYRAHPQGATMAKARGGYKQKGATAPRPWAPDTEDKRDNWKTSNKIPPEEIEFFGLEGWMPVAQATNLLAALGPDPKQTNVQKQ